VQRALRFHPAARVYAIGSWAARTMARPGTVVDVAVEMPRACFDEKDHLNHRYFARRAQYLGHLAAALRKHVAFKQVTWEFLCHGVRSGSWGLEESIFPLLCPAASGSLQIWSSFAVCVRHAINIPISIFNVGTAGQ
jgi:hypothetical protein